MPPVGTRDGGVDVALRPGETLIQTVWGPLVGFRNGTGVSRALARFGEYAVHEAAIYHRLLGGGTFLDIGANIGVVSVAMAALDPGRRVIAFEPQRTYFAAALLNLRRFPNAEIHPFALGAGETVVEVPEIDLDRQGNYGGLRLDLAPVAARRHLALATTVDAFLRRRQVLPGLVKIDAEGMEPEVIAGAAETLRHAAPILSVETDQRDPGGRVVDQLIAAGYRVFLEFFRAVSKASPRFDPADRQCQTLHTHVIAFGAAVPAWWLDLMQGNELRAAADFHSRFDRQFPS